MSKSLSPSEKLEKKLEKRRNQRIGLEIGNLKCLDIVGLDRVLLECKCGRKKEALWKNWFFKHSPTDCGHNQCEYSNVHGEVGTALYQKWLKIKKISISDEWRVFKPFKRWSLDNGYDEFSEVHRLDDSKPFSPQNARYYTKKEAYKRRKDLNI